MPGKPCPARQGGEHQVVSVLAEADECPDVCWICLGGPEADRPLMHPCKCPSWTHAHCIARWQLQSAGTRRERFCQFCEAELPDWKGVLTPCPGAAAPAVMNVNFDNKTYSFQVAPGADGYRQFTEAIRRAFQLPDDSELNITFTCDEPSAGSLLTLSGPGAYDAAVHCASVSAARRSMTGDEPGLASATQQACGGAGGAQAAGLQPQPGQAQQQQQPACDGARPSAAPAAADARRCSARPQPSPRPGGLLRPGGSGGRPRANSSSGASSSSSGAGRASSDAGSSSDSDAGSSRSSGEGGALRGAGGSALATSNTLAGAIAQELEDCLAGLADPSPALRSDAAAPAAAAAGGTGGEESGSAPSAGGTSRRGGGPGLGRKLRDAISELLASK